MAYDTKELHDDALKAIQDNNLFFFGDILGYVPVAKQTLYDHKLDESDDIKEALTKNRLKTKQGLRAKWYKSTNASLQIALMKLIADDDERKKISQSYHDVTTGGDKLNVALVEFVDGNSQDES